MQRRRLRLRSALATISLGFLLAGCDQSSDPEKLFADGDYPAALVVFEARAAGGDVEATNYLGVHYYLGLGVKRDLKRAAGFFEEAAVAKHAGAQRNLGIMFLRGLGVPQDKVRAYSWFYQSYEQGDPHAFKYLDFVSDYITPNQSMGARRWVKQFMRDARS